MKNCILNWLNAHPEWILRKQFLEGVIDYDLSRRVLRNSEKAYLSNEGKFYESLKDIPTFVDVQQVIKIASVFNDHELENFKNELLDCVDVDVLLLKKKAKEVAISKAQDYIMICDYRLKQLQNTQVIRSVQHE